ncbi:hypothetical protein [Bradyrhizobium canariense]|uniref:hypothetical protein n=1 Tax=Bradyrhizobium canariense TaxID=255045 RepID=UPI0013747DFB|nr:hypothetical protein [Bradyrhizobium canariense]
MRTRKGGELTYHTAVRIPQAIDKDKLDEARKGGLYQENLLRLETRALESVRKFARKNEDRVRCGARSEL